MLTKQTNARLALIGVVVVIGFGLASLVQARKPDDKPPAAASETIQGTWQVTGADAGGKHSPLEVSRKQFWTITRDRIVIRYDDGSKLEATYRLDPSSTPPTIDLKWTVGFRSGTSNPGLCEITGDTLRICWSGPDRPKGFRPDQALEDRAWRLFQLERVRQHREPARGHRPARQLAAVPSRKRLLCRVFPRRQGPRHGWTRQVRAFVGCRDGPRIQALQHFRWVRSLVWAPDGKSLYSTSDGEGIRNWDAATGKELWHLRGWRGW